MITVKLRFRVAMLAGFILLCAGLVWYFGSKHVRESEFEARQQKTGTAYAAVVSWRGVAICSDNELGHFPEGAADLGSEMLAYVAKPASAIFHPGPADAHASPAHISWLPVRGKNSAPAKMDALMLVLQDPTVWHDGLPRYYCAFVRRRGARKEDEPKLRAWLQAHTRAGDLQVDIEDQSAANYVFKNEYEGNRCRTPYTLEEIMLIHARLLQDANAASL